MSNLISTDESAPETSLRDVYYVLFRHKRRVVLFFVAVVVIVAAAALVLPEIYMSDAKLLVRLGRESVSLDPTATTGPVISVGQQREDEIKSELEILNSRDLVEKVVDALGPAAFLESPDGTDGKGGASGKDHSTLDGIREGARTAWAAVTSVMGSISSSQISDRDKAIIGVMKGLEIEALKNSNIITISFEAKSRKVAQETINKLIEFYLEKHLSVHRTAGSYQFFGQQTGDFKETLLQAEENLRAMKNKTGITSLEEQRRVLITRIGDLQRESEGTETSLAASKAKVAGMEKALADLPETLVTQETAGIGNTGADLMRAKLYELQLKENELLTKFSESSKRVQDIRQQIAEGQALLQKEERTRNQVTTGLNEPRKQMFASLLAERVTLNALQAQGRKQREQLDKARGTLNTINESEIRLNEAQREVSIQEANYRKYWEKLEQARIDNALELGKISSISVVQGATYPITPVRPKKKLMLALALFLGAFGGLAIAFFSEYLDHSFKTSEDVERRLQLRTMTAIPFMDRKELASETYKSGGKTSNLLGTRVNGNGYQKAFEERLLLAVRNFSKTPKVIGLTSCHRGEGVSFVALQLAAILARKEGTPVLLVDCNAHGEKPPKVTEVRFDGRDRTNINNDFSEDGLNPEIDFSGLPNLKTIASRLSLWKSNYNFILFDLPPVLEETSALHLASMTDGVILVTEAERVRWEVAQSAKSLLEQAKANVIGVVLNKRRYHVPGFLYKRL